MTGPDDLDEWSLAGLTREQGIARWTALFAGQPPTSRKTMSTSWGWLAWEPADAETAQLAHLAKRTPPPVLVEIAVRDPDSRPWRSSPRPAADPVTTSAWSGLTGLMAGGAVGVWWWGLTGWFLVLAVAAAVGATGAAALWRWLTASRRPAVRILTERDGVVADVFAGAKVLTWVTDHLRIHESVIAEEQRRTSGIPAEQPAEFAEAVDQLHRALWALATGRADDPRAMLTGMTDYAGLVLQLIDARERVQRASTVRIAPPPPPRVREPAAERLRDAGRRLDDAINGQRHAARVVGDINRRFDDAG